MGAVVRLRRAAQAAEESSALDPTAAEVAGTAEAAERDQRPVVPTVEPAFVPASTVRRRARWASIPYRLYWAHVAGLFGLALSNSLLGLAVLASPLSRQWHRLRDRAVWPLLVAVAAYVALLGLSIVASFDPARSARSSSELFSLCTLVLGLVLLRDERAVRRIVDAVLLLATAESLYGLVQLAAAGGPNLDRRIQGSLSHYMTFSGILLVADVLLLARLFARGREAGWRAWALVPINAALIATLTRSAWVGLGVGMLVLLLLSRRRLLLWWLPVGLLALLVLPSAVLERAASIVDPDDWTNFDRVCMARAGWSMIRERPLLGQGPDMVEVRYPLYRLPEAPRREVPHLHDAFLHVAAERGVPAMIALLALLGIPAARALAAYRREGWRAGPRADLWLGTIGAVVAFSVAGLFENNWGDVEVQRLVLVLLAVPYGLPAADDGQALDT
ncbi:MAG TPA: O-antigen ligase family protein [Thermoanaerobaculia bacterium]|nr:O-antigen ligase family protein [Thermoanaerobaculia bacterium]